MGRTDRLNWLERLIRWLLLQWFVRSGWTVPGTLPPDRKFVIMGASHTSNWDFLVFLGAVHAWAAESISSASTACSDGRWAASCAPWAAIPVDRSARQDLVSQVVAEFDAHDDFILVIAPEGTRSRTTDWKTGFYQIALKAGVPIVCRRARLSDQTRRVRAGNPADRQLCR